MRKFILISILSLNFAFYGQVDKSDKLHGYWMYKDDYTTKQLILKKNNRFNWYYSSCNGDICLKGQFEIKYDTIYLRPKKNEVIKFLVRNERILSYQGKNKDYPDFQPLTNSKDQTKLKCNNDRVEIMDIE